MLSITGAIYRNDDKIPLHDAEAIVSEFCDIAEDEEKDVRLGTLQNTYTKGDDFSQVAGWNYLYYEFKEMCSGDKDEAKKSIERIKAGFQDALDDLADGTSIAKMCLRRN